jgi:hypothetical protein
MSNDGTAKEQENHIYSAGFLNNDYSTCDSIFFIRLYAQIESNGTLLDKKNRMQNLVIY